MKKQETSTLLDSWRAQWNTARSARGDARASLRIRVYEYLVRRYGEHPIASLPAQVETSSGESSGRAPHLGAREKAFRQQALLRARASLRRLAQIHEACE